MDRVQEAEYNELCADFFTFEDFCKPYSMRETATLDTDRLRGSQREQLMAYMQVE